MLKRASKEKSVGNQVEENFGQATNTLLTKWLNKC